MSNGNRKMRNMAVSAEYRRGIRIMDAWRNGLAELEAKRRAEEERRRRESGEGAQTLAWARRMDPARMARLACAGKGATA